MEIDSSEEEQIGGLAAPPLQSRQVLQRLYDPKLTQARFTEPTALRGAEGCARRRPGPSLRRLSGGGREQ